MSKAIKFSTYVAIGITCLILFAACSADDDGTALPDGKYPMTFTTQVEGLTATRAATANGEWTTTDRIAVKVSNDGVKQYAPASGGSASATLSGVDADNTFYWQTSNETKTVTAWYCGNGSTASGQTNAGAVPASWAVQADQSGMSSPDGYQQSDFLYAPATDIAFNNRSTQSLNFYHQTAKVIINIKNEEASTDAGKIQSVVIGHANNLSLSGAYTAPTSGSTAGTWDIASSSKGTITTKKLTNPNQISDSETALASYTALVIPQDMKDKKFIAITLSNGGGSDTYYYTPTQDNDANLQSGKQHTFDITVKHGYLEVSVSISAQWTGGSEDVPGNAQTVTPGTDGSGSGWRQDSDGDVSVSGTDKSNNP